MLSRRGLLAGAALMAAAPLGPGVRAQPLKSDFTFFFTSRSGQLTPEARTLGDAVADLILATDHDPVTRVEIVGHTDTAETEPEKLSLARVRAVMQYLLGKGVPAHLFDVQAVGASDQQVPTPPDTPEPLNRSVTVRITSGAGG